MIIRSMAVSIMMAAMRGSPSTSQQYWRQLGAVINIVQLSFFCAVIDIVQLQTIFYSKKIDHDESNNVGANRVW